ncbi:SDR family oxidoreductase [Bdellovibrionota bacterium FG-2]
MKKTLILGATSAIAQAVCELLVQKGDSLFLVGRDSQKLDAIVSDLKVRGGVGVHVESRVSDLDDLAGHEALIDEAARVLGGLDQVLIAHGVLGDQKKAEVDFSHAHQILQTNFLSPVSLLNLIANRFEAQKHGAIAMISSVAGDRGRQSNYVYGASKGGLNVFLEGLRNRLSFSGVRVLTIKPGFVDTPMTKDFKKGLLWASPEQVARGIVRAMDTGKDVTYLPFFWRWIMLVIRHIPESVFKRMKL